MVIIYSTMNHQGLTKDSQIEAKYDDLSRREAFEAFLKTKPEDSPEWRFNRRNLTAKYQSRTSLLEVKFFFTEYLTEEEFHRLRDGQ